MGIAETGLANYPSCAIKRLLWALLPSTNHDRVVGLTTWGRIHHWTVSGSLTPAKWETCVLTSPSKWNCVNIRKQAKIRASSGVEKQLLVAHTGTCWHSLPQYVWCVLGVSVSDEKHHVALYILEANCSSQSHACALSAHLVCTIMHYYAIVQPIWNQFEILQPITCKQLCEETNWLAGAWQQNALDKDKNRP